jgi:hypothetical protein
MEDFIEIENIAVLIATKKMRAKAPGTSLFGNLMFCELVNSPFLVYLTTF